MSQNTNWRHNSLVETDYRNSKLTTNIQCEKKNHSAFSVFRKIVKKINKNNYTSKIFWTFKSKLQIINAATYIALFLSDSNNCVFICLLPYIFPFCIFYFHLVFLLCSPQDLILQFTVWFNFIVTCP